MAAARSGQRFVLPGRYGPECTCHSELFGPLIRFYSHIKGWFQSEVAVCPSVDAVDHLHRVNFQGFSSYLMQRRTKLEFPDWICWFCSAHSWHGATLLAASGPDCSPILQTGNSCLWEQILPLLRFVSSWLVGRKFGWEAAREDGRKAWSPTYSVTFWSFIVVVITVNILLVRGCSC